MSSLWSVLVVALSFATVVGLLWAASVVEQRLLSSPSLIVSASRSRHVGPDTVELYVAKKSEDLLPRAS